ncbi:hypothetical protein [Nonomuraea typhae]|uniref:Conjugal transfer protein TraI n=1 Tax=Nonomuraea typhae TaxID=2603600 RepID=A0ABW7YSN9_9ACTN
MTMTAPGRVPAEIDGALPGKTPVELLAEIDRVLTVIAPAAVPEPGQEAEVLAVAAELTESEPDDAAGGTPAFEADSDGDGDDGDENADGGIVPHLPFDAAAWAELGETERVQRQLKKTAEAHRLVELQADKTVLLVDSPKVVKHERRARQAARLHELAQDPVTLAYRDARMRRTVTLMVGIAAVIAFAVSSIGVQASVATAQQLTPGSLGWWAAYLVEAVLSLPLLAAVAVQAYSAMRGQVVDRGKGRPGRKLLWVEGLLLGLTLILNCWPALTARGFDLLTLIVHSLGPIAAVTAVWVLPALWAVLEALPVPTPSGTGGTGGGTAHAYRANAGLRYSPPPRPKADVPALIERARKLIEAGQLPAGAGIRKISQALGCGTDNARRVQRALAEAGGTR